MTAMIAIQAISYAYNDSYAYQPIYNFHITLHVRRQRNIQTYIHQKYSMFSHGSNTYIDIILYFVDFRLHIGITSKVYFRSYMV